MAALLAATGAFIYTSLRSELDRAVAQGLRSRAGDVGALVQQSDTGLREAARSPAGGREGGFAQILDRSGRVFDATPGLRRQPLLRRADIHASRTGPHWLELGQVPGLTGRARLLTTPVHAQGRDLVLVVGASQADRDRALASLGARFVFGGPIALALAALAGYGLATGALRPVESMRARAAAISPEDLDHRLPVPAARDELHRLGRTLNAMLDRLQEGQSRERSLVADASHELRTPLAMLTTELELIARDRPRGEELHRAARSALVEANHLTGLTRDLLLLAQSDADRVLVKPERVRVEQLLTGVSRRYPHVTFDVAPDLELWADPARLEQALVNMLDNALHHGAPPVRVEALERRGRVELHVTDSGPGFPPDFLPRAFERFARADAGRRTRGTGLGLAIVQAIARAHRGSAQVANQTEGTDVWIALPNRAAAERNGIPTFNSPGATGRLEE